MTSAVSLATIASGFTQLFAKSNPSIVAFTKTAVNTAQLAVSLRVEINNIYYTYDVATAVTMPTLTAGTDYAIYACTDGTIRADSSYSVPTGYTTLTSRQIGGFHYAPGGHSGSPGGGNSTPQINEYSFWDLKFRPSSNDTRGRTLVAGKFWASIYLTGVDHIANGISKYGVTIADGASPPKIPTQFGGTGSNAYGSLNWWESAEVCLVHGMRMPTYSEFAALAYGTTEASSIGTDPVSTNWNATYISKWGVSQVTGNIWVWGDEFGGGAAAAGWTANTGGRGSTYQMENAVLFGGYWGDPSNSGSRCSLWNNSPTYSSLSIGVRGVCDHLILP